DAFAVFLAQGEEAVSGDALQRFEQYLIQQAPVVLFGAIKLRSAGGEGENRTNTPAPFAEVAQNEQRGVHQIEVGEGAVEIVKSRTSFGFSVAVGGIL